MIELKQRRILIDDQPGLILCGEIHYFRLARSDWQDRLDKLKSAGCNTVSSYIPWLCHEPVQGRIDLEGKTRPELDLGAFIDLCRDNGLAFFARPGPFVMAELKNEGLPYWLYIRYPDIVPVGWDSAPATTRTVDYLAPDFLREAQRWYEAVLAILNPRLQSRNGNVIALQLDNEVGMLSWVSNTPDLTDLTLNDFSTWLEQRYDPGILHQRYPFDLWEPETRAAAIRSPSEAYAPALMRDLGLFQRERLARYIATLRNWAENAGISGIPFLVNIHGTGGGRGLTFPVGISQLYEAYTRDSYLVGSDFYLGNLTPDNFQDLYLCNALIQSTLTPEQVLCSAEFECGSGDYGHMQGNRYDPSAVDLKTRMSIAQGNRLLNYYLFSGGINYLLKPPPGDGDDRIGITGEEHGVAAPVRPNGNLCYTYPRMARIIQQVGAMAQKLADMDECLDGVSFGFIPDYFMTEARYPRSQRMRDIISNIEANRASGAWESMARAMLLAGYRFNAIDVQRQALDIATVPVMALGSARYMDREVQQKIVAWMRAGGGLLLFGEVPLYDMEGRPCGVLSEALGVIPVGRRRSTAEYFLSLVAEGWAAPRFGVRTHFAQIFDPGAAEVLLRLHGTGETTAFDARVGNGRAIVIATAYTCDIGFFRAALSRLGASPELSHDCPHVGLFMTSTANSRGESIIHVMNLDGFEKAFRLYKNGRRLLGGATVRLPPREGLMIPLNLQFGEVCVRFAAAEVIGCHGRTLSFRCLQAGAIIVLETDREFYPNESFTLQRKGRLVRLSVRQARDRIDVTWH